MPEFSAKGPAFTQPTPYFCRAGKIMLDLSRPKVMGIINLSPDSFYAGSRIEASDKLLEKAEKMLEEGASILDIGAMSSRPGAVEIKEEDEIKLLTPAIKLLKSRFPDLAVSADVFRQKSIEAALSEGADIINNICGMAAGYDELYAISKAKAAYVIMHSRGNFSQMHHTQHYHHLIPEVASELSFAIDKAREAGITDIIADPGFGFSKNPEQNFLLFRDLRYLQEMWNCPLLIGISRKSMIYRSLNCLPEEALNGSTALHMAALLQGAHLLRVHDVKPAMETIQLFEKLCLQEL